MDDWDNNVSYTGSLDDHGSPHGRGTLHFSSGDRFEGKFNHGDKDGKGTFYFTDGSCLSGNWRRDVLHGVGTYTYEDGSTMVAKYIDGDLEGQFREYDPRGTLIASGTHKRNIRFGICHFWDEFGGCIFGEMNRRGMLSGSNITYVYPDHITGLIGQFKNGELVDAFAADRNYNGVMSETFFLHKPELRYRKDVSTRDRISKDPLLPDAFELKRVYVGISKIPNAGEGLFSKVNAQDGEIMSFYNGVRLSHEEVDERDWTLNSNTISLDDETVIDVPEKYADIGVYCATLGHKANHSFVANCKYDRFDHPRFGKIKCIRTITNVSPGDELTVEYGYNHSEVGQEAPLWYLNAKRDFLNVG